MNSTALRTRLLTASGATLAAAGLAATMVAGVAAAQEDANVTANADVASVIELSADDTSFTLTGAPGDTDSTTSELTATSNNEGGYNVTVLTESATLDPEGADNTDTIPVSSLEVEGTALSDTDPVTVHTQDSRSGDDGDLVTANYSLTMPHVNADTYTGVLTFTAAAN